MTILLLAAGLLSITNGIGPWMVRADLIRPSPSDNGDAVSLSNPAGSRWLEQPDAALYCLLPESRPRPGSVHRAKADYWLGWPVATRAVSDALWLALLALALGAGRVSRPIAAARLLFAALLGLALLGALKAITHGRWLELLVGGLALMPWCLSVIGRALAIDRVRHHFALVCVFLLAFQGLLAPSEMQSNMSPYGTQLLGLELHRLVGTFDLPVAIGVFSAVTWAAALQWAGFTTRHMVFLSALVAIVLLASGSATGWAAWLAAVSNAALLRTRPKPPRILLALALPCTIALWVALPVLTGRADVHDSLWGRILPAYQFSQMHLQWSDSLFGYRFGAGTQNFEPLLYAKQISLAPNIHPPTDSLPMVLFWQTGLVGVLSAYGLMLLALWRDPDSQPVGAALVVGSIALSIGEQLLLGIALALWLSRALNADRETTSNQS